MRLEIDALPHHGVSFEKVGHRRSLAISTVCLAALALCLTAAAGYLLIDQQPRPNGGSWYGYTLGTIGFGLIIWLSLMDILLRDFGNQTCIV